MDPILVGQKLVLIISDWNVYIAGWTLPEGEHRIYVGSSSRNIQQSGNITLSLD